MAFSILYKKLLEVNILHGYYLNKGNRKDFFELEDAERETALGNYDISKDIEIIPTPSTQRLLHNFHIKFLKTTLGFELLVKVTQGVKGNGSPVFFPMIPITPGLRLQFYLGLRNPWMVNLSSGLLRPRLISKYYFSNLRPPGQMTYPSLALKASDFLQGKHYEMGERVYRQNKLFEAIRNTNTTPTPTAADWTQLTDYRQLSERDRNLCSFRLQYSFPGQVIVASAQLTLTNADNGATVQAGFGNGTTPLRDIVWDLRGKVWEPTDVPGEGPEKILKPGAYLLEVSGDNNYTDKKEVFIQPEWTGTGAPSFQAARQASEAFAFLDLGHEPGLGDFRLLEPDGSLREEGANGNSLVKHPIFELRFRNRTTYWHFFYHKDQQTIQGPFTDVALHPADQRRLVSIKPQPLTRIPSDIVLKDTTKLPNPQGPTIKLEAGTVYSEVYLPNLNS